jgi:hypothetical protein
MFLRFVYKSSYTLRFAVLLAWTTGFTIFIVNPLGAQSMTKVEPIGEARPSNNTMQSQQRKAMASLAFLVGEWEGDGWIQLSSTRKDVFKQYQRVESLLDGVLMTIEGRGLAQIQDKTINKTYPQSVPSTALAHHAFAFVSPSDQPNEYKWRSHTSDGRAQDVIAKVISKNSLRWGFQMPNGHLVRYTINIDADDRWHEMGELSSDGRTWRHVFDMKLKRLKQPI